MMLLLSLSLSACSTTAPKPVTPGIVRLDGTTIDPPTLTTRIEELTKAANVQGLTVTVFNDAQVVYLQAFGSANLPAGQPLRTDTELYGASLSKAVFGVLVMRLVEQGVIDLDKPLQDYVKEPLWANQGKSWRICLPLLRLLCE
jgi:CubicO group peptidase (beta-lactamase class C family)